MAANNETGVLQPIDKIAAMAAEVNVAVHSDMVQIYGKRHLDFTQSQISYASISAHKREVNWRWCRASASGQQVDSACCGRRSEQGRRAGTEIWLVLRVSALRRLMPLPISDIMSQWRNGGMISRRR